MRLDPFYLILADADWIDRLVPLGVRLVQLRLKSDDDTEIRRAIRRAKATCAAAGCTLVINDHWRQAIDEGCDWVHLGQEDLADADRGALRAAGLKLGLSTHDRAELQTALAAEPDYIALGPIWPTLLKQMPWQPQTPERLARWKAEIGGLPLVAIGGLNPDRIETVFAQGADSAAVVTDITLNADPEARTREWIARTAPWR